MESASISLTLLHWVLAALALLGEPQSPHDACYCDAARAAQRSSACDGPMMEARADSPSPADARRGRATGLGEAGPRRETASR